MFLFKYKKTQVSESGFTLVELLVVTLLLSVMAAILYGSITGIMRGRKAVEGIRHASLVAEYVLEQFTKDLTSRELVALSSNAGSGETQSGFRGFNTSAYMIGENIKESEQDADILKLVTRGTPFAAIGGQPNYGLIELEYRLEQSDEEDREIGAKNTYQLVRDERPASNTDKKLIEARTRVVPIASGVRAINFRYLRDGTWQDEWKTSSIPFPEAIEISLTLLVDNEHEETFRTAVAISKRQNRRVSLRQPGQ